MTHSWKKDPLFAQDTQTPFSRFRKDEDGGMIIFSLFMFVLVLTLAGLAVDLMRFETTRAKSGMSDFLDCQSMVPRR